MEAELDLKRLSELQQLLGTELSEIVATLLRELASAISAIDAGLETGDLGAVALAAHAARNSAMMIGAQPLLSCLDELETSARDPDLDRATGAHQRLRQHWPGLRAQLQRATTAGG